MAAGGSELLATQPNGCCLLLLHDRQCRLRLLEAHALTVACVRANTMIYAAAVKLSACVVHASMYAWMPELLACHSSTEVRLAKATF